MIIIFDLYSMLLVEDGIKHSEKEKRYFVLGQTDIARKLFLVFTTRKQNIRVISARDMNKRERKAYEKHNKENS